MAQMRRMLGKLGLYIGVLVAGCSQATLGTWQGPTQQPQVQVQDWSFGEKKACTLHTHHYRIHTTIEDDEMLRELPQVMEGALSMYKLMSPGIKVSDTPMDCYVFRWRSEWNQFTQHTAGADAAIYLQIRSGGYTLKDMYVAYYIGRIPTFSVAAHEGWHQYCGRHFKGRLPPFVEEGLACMFETISWKDNLPRWNLSINSPRAQTLRRAIEAKDLQPLAKLCAMHAGDIVGETNERIDAFYAQAWAFARFMYEADNGKYRPALEKWLAETADGTVHDRSGSHRRSTHPWNRRAVLPMIEHYLGMDIAQIEQAYQAYMRKIAYEEFTAQTQW